MNPAGLRCWLWLVVCGALAACAPRDAPGDAAYRQPALGDAARLIPKGKDTPGAVTGGPVE